MPADGVSRDRLDPPRGDSGAGRRTIPLPRERSRAWPQRSAQLVCFARRPGNQQFVSKHSSSVCPRPVAVRSCNQRRRGRELWRMETLRAWCPKQGLCLLQSPGSRSSHGASVRRTHVTHGPALVHIVLMEDPPGSSSQSFPDRHLLKSSWVSCRYHPGLGKRSPALQACIRTRNTQADGAPKGAWAPARPSAGAFPFGRPLGRRSHASKTQLHASVRHRAVPLACRRPLPAADLSRGSPFQKRRASKASLRRSMW